MTTRQGPRQGQPCGGNVAGYVIAWLLLPVLVGGPANVLANGDAFFRFDVFDMSGVPIEEQTIYTGSVKDTQGNYVEDATITVGITVPTPRGERLVSYNAYTDVVGRYRTLDVASVILAMEEIEYDVDPAEVEVTVEKDGYELERKLDRSRRSQKGGIFEVDFVLAPVDER